MNCINEKNEMKIVIKACLFMKCSQYLYFSEFDALSLHNDRVSGFKMSG